MKSLLVAFSLFITLFSTAQIEGDLKTDNRNLTEAKSFELKGAQEGVMVFDIAVDIEGKVTSVVLNREKSTVKSTPSAIKAKNYILTFQFEKGTHFPMYHQGTVTITFVK